MTNGLKRRFLHGKHCISHPKQTEPASAVNSSWNCASGSTDHVVLRQTIFQIAQVRPNTFGTNLLIGLAVASTLSTVDITWTGPVPSSHDPRQKLSIYIMERALEKKRLIDAKTLIPVICASRYRQPQQKSVGEITKKKNVFRKVLENLNVFLLQRLTLTFANLKSA